MFGPRDILGVDIGTSSIKIAEIGKTTDQLKLKNYGILETYGHLERLNNAIQTSSLKMMEKETAELLASLLAEIRPETKNCIASLPVFLAFTTLLELPEMSEADTSKTVAFQARQYIPLPISEVSLEWQKVGEREDAEGIKKQQIILASVPNDHIKKYKAIFKAAGLKLISLEIEAFSIARSLFHNDDPTPTVLIDIGARSSSVMIVDKGAIKYISQTDFAGSSLTQAIASGLNINIRRAETLKKQRGLLGSGGEYELSTIIQPFVDAIIEEAKRAVRIYEETYEGKIERVVLTGGGANLLGLEKYFSDQIGLSAMKGNPFTHLVYPGEIEPAINELNSLFAVAVGLGIKEFIK